MQDAEIIKILIQLKNATVINACSICGYSLCNRSIAQMKRHIRVHTNIRPYKCLICKKCFKQSSNCYHHIRHVHKEKDYMSYIRIIHKLL